MILSIYTYTPENLISSDRSAIQCDFSNTKSFAMAFETMLHGLTSCNNSQNGKEKRFPGPLQAPYTIIIENRCPVTGCVVAKQICK